LKLAIFPDYQQQKNAIGSCRAVARREKESQVLSHNNICASSSSDCKIIEKSSQDAIKHTLEDITVTVFPKW